MRKLLSLFITFIVLGVSCTEPEIKQSPSVYELAASQLRKEGYIAEYLQDKNVLLISSSLDLHDMSLKLNTIFDHIKHPERKLVVDEESPNARTQGVSCRQSGVFYDSGGATCVNYLCIADSSYSILWYYDCINGTCYAVTTSCWE